MSIDTKFKLPIYVKSTIFLVGLFVLFMILYICQEIIVPLVFSIIIAILLHPVVNFLVSKKINRVFAIAITLSSTFFILIAIGLLIFTQAIQFSESWPILIDNFTSILNQTITWFSGYFNMNPQNIHIWISKTKDELLHINGALIGKTIVTLSSGILIMLLIPVYIFMILFYQPILIDFIHKLFISSNQSKVQEIITQIKTVIQRYLFGLVIEFALVSALNTVVLLALGIDYAILLGIIGGLLNIIPYVGGLAGVALPMLVALATKDSGWYAIYILISYYFIQLIDNNYIVPKIVSSKVKINALFSIIVVLAGNALWGLTGMFLSIPLLAIVKLIFDHIESLKPWGFLLGDTMPNILKIKPVFKKQIKKSI